MPAAASPPMRDLLRREVALLVDRVRDFTPARFAAAAAPYGTRADALWHLAEGFVAAAGVPHELPRLPDTALADVLAVTGHDLDRSAPDDGLAAAVLAEVMLHRYDVDGQRPGARLAARVLAGLPADPMADTAPGPGAADAAAALLSAARRRCPRYRTAG